MNFAETSDNSILDLLGDRIKRERLNQNRTQIEISTTAGVALNVIKRLEKGRGCTLSNFVRILRALDKLDHIDTFLPDPGVSPIQLARLSGRERKEASGKRGQSRKEV
jgi:transcriptional regulator with XRE-family HTH domain